MAPFGAVETKLRYDGPIRQHDPKTGRPLPSIDYASAWHPKLNDVVVFLPNGSRFVFWRGSSYAPFWASRYNTGINYQWVEDLNHPTDHPSHPNTIRDFPEVMFDSELRHSRVRIVESTASRIHVQWTYQPTTIYGDLRGEEATEDFYFYPDGFGTRVVTLSAPKEERSRFQLSEFLILGPQSAYPFEILPERLIDILPLNGRSVTVRFPVEPDQKGSLLLADPALMPVLYKIFAHRQDPEPAIYFSPQQIGIANAWPPMKDRGAVVTPAYWGAYWPLARGEATSWIVDDRLFSGPSFSSIAALHSRVPGLEALDARPLWSSEAPTLDALGHTRLMVTERWAWLIGKTDAADDELRKWAQSYSQPPSLQIKGGARIDFPSYSPERRAIRLVSLSPSIEIQLKPAVHTMNPVFEIEGAFKDVLGITVDGKTLPEDAYAWDGATLWMSTSIDARGVKINLQFR